MDNKIVVIRGGDYLITENADDAYRVMKGTVLLFIVPFNNNTVGRRSFVYEASEGEIIPGFSFRDIEYCNWRFCLVAVEEAEISIMNNASTKVLQKKFCEKANIKSFQIEGYNNSLVDQYRNNTVAEDSFIRRTQNNRDSANKSILNLIYNAFGSKKHYEISEPTKCKIYNAMSLLCVKNRINIASYDKVFEDCGEDIGVEDIARLSNFAYREVILTEGWQKTDSGSFLVFIDDDKPYVCLPKGTSYVLYDVESSSSVPVSKKIASTINPRAYMVYRPLPATSINAKDIASFCVKSIKCRDIIWLLLLTIITSLIGLITPKISQSIYDEYIPIGAISILFQIGCVLAAFMLANVMFMIVKSLVSFRITSRMSYDLQSAVYYRLFTLPESFFRNYESADLAQRVLGIGVLTNTVTTHIVSIVVTLIFVVIYYINMISYSLQLTLIGTAMVLVYGICYYFIAMTTIKRKKKAIEIEGQSNSKIFQFLSGISKIRIAGVEDRALFEYLKEYVRQRNLEESVVKINGLETTLSLIINTVFSIVLYCVVINSKAEISFGSFIAFSTVFGSFCVYFMQGIASVVGIRQEKPNMDRIKPVLEATPEIDEGKVYPGEISGAIEVNNVTFSYDVASPAVLDGVSLNIKPGEYVGIVGPSGCGKSTLLKLFLGFEKPTSGKIYYDNKDIESINKRELRKKMGVVLQDGKLISGSIYENITITSPKATLRDVREVVKAVGLEKDINEMPMGLHTVLSEDSGTISGGQQQRILIARAIISKPNILFLDEATSALDNVTQSMVISTIEKINSTRIVIAHRLSTIINCDRIIVMDAGKIIEQGNYAELMKKKGLFYALASRQMA